MLNFLHSLILFVCCSDKYQSFLFVTYDYCLILIWISEVNLDCLSVPVLLNFLFRSRSMYSSCPFLSLRFDLYLVNDNLHHYHSSKAYNEKSKLKTKMFNYPLCVIEFSARLSREMLRPKELFKLYRKIWQILLSRMVRKYCICSIAVIVRAINNFFLSFPTVFGHTFLRQMIRGDTCRTSTQLPKPMDNIRYS